MQPLNAPPQASSGGFDTRKVIEDISRYADIARRGWRFLVIGILVSLTAAGIHISQAKTSYRAMARLLVIQQGGRTVQIAGTSDPFQGLQNPNDSLATHLMLIRSPVIVERAVAQSGLKTLSVPAVIDGLAVKLPDPSARIIELTYKANSAEEAAEVVDAIMDSYKTFLRENYQKSTNEVIKLFEKVRDELSKELEGLENDLFKFQQEHYASKEGNAPRQLEQWDQRMDVVMGRILQLQTQLDQGKKLASKGVDQATLANVLNQFSLISGAGGQLASNANTDGVPGVATGQTLDRELTDVVTKRQTAEYLLDHLKQQQAEAASAKSVTDKEISRAFYADPEVAELQSRLKRAKERLEANKRLTRNASDPSVVRYHEQVTSLQQQLNVLWQERRSELADELMAASNPDLTASIHAAEADLVRLKATEAALTERLRRAAADELERLRSERETLARDKVKNASQITQIDQRIDQLEGRSAAGRVDGVSALLDSLSQSLESMKSLRDDLQKKLDEARVSAQSTEITQLEESKLKSKLSRQQTVFDSVVDQLKQAQLVSEYGSVASQIVNPTSVAAERPKTSLILVAAILCGCCLGGFAAFVADALDARVRTLPEIRKLIELPVIGLIPQLSSDQVVAVGKVGLLSHKTPRSALAESYKSTRTNLEFLRRNRRAQILLISSPHPGDGKSTTASNLAITLASTGRRVLLVDGDLRKPSLHTIYDLDRERGFSNALIEGKSITELALPTSVPNLDLLTTGPDTSNPAELLASQRLGEFLDELRTAYDTVIIDSSPLLAVTDPSIIAAVADGLILVLRVASTRRHDVERTTELMRTLGVPVLGMVVNGITRQQMGYGYGGYGYGYGGYGYGYGYGYGHGYGRTYGQNGHGHVYGDPMTHSDGSENGNGNGVLVEGDRASLESRRERGESPS